jgi:hypothetical protein
MKAEELIALKDSLVEKAKTRDKLEGQLEALLAALKEEHGITSIEEAKTEVESIQKKVDDLEEKIGLAEESFKEKYGQYI